MDVALVLGILLGRRCNDSRWKIHLLVMAFTATRGARGCYLVDLLQGH